MTTDLSATDGTTGTPAIAALGDGTRRAIVELLADRPRAVGELAALLPVSRPAVSLHLRVLKDAGLVDDTAIGTRRVYRLDPAGLQVLRTYIDRLWAGALDRFASAAEAVHAADPDHPTEPRRPRDADPGS